MAERSLNLKRTVVAVLIALACSFSVFAVDIHTMSWTGVDREVATYARWATEYSQAHPGVNVIYDAITSDYAAKLLSLFAAGTPPDFFYAGATDMPLYVSKGMLEPIDAYASGSNGFDFSDLVTPAARIVIKGKTYCWMNGFFPYLIYYNKKLFDQAGVKYPTDNWTWDDVAAAAKKLTKKQGGNTVQYGFQADEYNRVWMSYVWSNGGKLFDNDNAPTKILFNDPVGLAGLKWLGDMVSSLNVAPPPGVKGALSFREAFENQKVAMTMDGAWMLSQFNAKTDLSYGVAMLPMGSKGRTVWSGADGWVLSATGKHKDIAWDIVKTKYVSKEAELQLADFGGPNGLGIPSLKSALSDPRWKPAPMLSIPIRESAMARPEPAFIDESRWAWELFNNAVEQLMLTKGDPQAIMNDFAQKTNNEILPENQ
jgi:multiple sugar transport system substrate-binding protein